MSRTDFPEEAHQHSGWLIPLGFLAAILVLSGLFLLYDLRPGRLGFSGGARSGNTAPVHLRVDGVALAVPANYLDDPRGGARRDVLMLSALLPDMRGYSIADAGFFTGNAPDSPVAHLLFKGDDSKLDAAGRLARIYMPYIQNAQGRPAPFGLIQYDFRPDSGYGRTDLFAGTGKDGLVLLLCERASPQLPSPNCLSAGRPVGGSLSFSYRYKRAYLARWRGIADGMDGLLARFRAG